MISNSKDGDETKVLTGEECFRVTKYDQDGRPVKMTVSEAAKNIAPKSILLTRGLPTLKWQRGRYTGEYARVNTGQLEISNLTWTDDGSRARDAHWDGFINEMESAERDFGDQDANLGSRGVLRVNLNFEF